MPSESPGCLTQSSASTRSRPGDVVGAAPTSLYVVGALSVWLLLSGAGQVWLLLDVARGRVADDADGAATDSAETPAGRSPTR